MKANQIPNKTESLIQVTDQSGTVFKGFYIWSDLTPATKADPDQVYAKCLVLPGSNKNVLNCRQVDPPGDDTEFTVSTKNAYNSNSNIDPLSFNDIGLIPHTNSPCVLDFLKQRFMEGQVYTTADPLLVAINPFQDLANTTDDIILKYRDEPNPDKLPPHVFLIARNALENLHQLKKSQTIIVSGESGSGKTEATKQIMRYFASAKSGTIDARIQTSVLAANPVLEAFGNAKTVRNNNSSRFGRFMQLTIPQGGGIDAGSVRNFLLEKSRIVTQDDDERSYHIFYQFLKGASNEMRTKYKLKKINDYKFLNPKCLDIDGIEDEVEWFNLLKSFESMQLTPDDVDSILSIVSGILLLGNVEMTGNEYAQIKALSKKTFTDACSLMFLDPSGIEEGICMKFSTAGGETLRGRWSEKDADILKLSLAKAMYEKLFDWIVRQLNKNIKGKLEMKIYMGMLDIFGFEVFTTNSIEQLFINITNELLQKNFIDIVFEKEIRLYRKEKITAADLVWTSNEPIINALIDKKSSLITVLEDQCLAPAPTDEKFLSALYNQSKKSDKIVPGKVQPNINFIINHTIGPIQYNCIGFIAKNTDILRGELVNIVNQSKNPVCRELFAGFPITKGKLAKGQLIDSQFVKDLTELIQLINATEPHFIRCIKPNENKKPLEFTNSKVLIQLCALSVLEALELRGLGYSYRRTFEEFVQNFRFINLSIAHDTKMPKKDAALKLLERAKIPSEDYQMGVTMVFLKSKAIKNIAQQQREAISAWGPLVELIEVILIKKKKENQIMSVLPGLVRFQAQARRFLLST